MDDEQVVTSAVSAVIQEIRNQITPLSDEALRNNLAGCDEVLARVSSATEPYQTIQLLREIICLELRHRGLSPD